MSDHPTTPPPELVQQWIGEFFGCKVSGELASSEQFLANRAAQWCADLELEACCAIALTDPVCGTKHQRRMLVSHIREQRRPKPPSLKAKLTEALQNENIGEALRLVEQLDD